MGTVEGLQSEIAETATATAPARGPVELGGPLTPERILSLQRAAGNRAVGRMLSRKEVGSPFDLQGPIDWTTADRVNNTKAWKQACLAILNNVDTTQFRRVQERRDFYWWFYAYTAEQGYQTRWPLAAAIVANGAHLIADMDKDHASANANLSLANVELQGMMREGNEVIFKDVLPKLKKLADGGPLKGRAALEWDMQALAEEQTLIQSMYGGMSQETRDELEYIARQKRFSWLGAWITGEGHVNMRGYNREGDVPAFDKPDMQSITDRWLYGMGLGKKFAPQDTGFDPSRDKMPAVGADYTSGAAFKRLDTHAALHELDAWLNPNRIARTGSGSDLNAIIGRLTASEKVEVLADDPADGGHYSIWFGAFRFITEAQVRAALPADAASAADVDLFVQRFKAEQRRSQAANPLPVPMMR